MSAYLSFYKDKEHKEHLLTVSRINPMVEYITDKERNKLGMLSLISEMLFDNKGILYLSYG